MTQPVPQPRGGFPWWLRLAIKLALARVPVPYGWWRRIGVFRHGCLSDDIERRSNGFLTHSGHYRRLSDAPLRSVVELGPGDSVATALYARGVGVERCWLIDTGRFAVDDPAHYRAARERAVALGHTPPAIAVPETIEAVLAATGGVYLTDGVDSLAAIPADSVDLVFSTAVLEHIRHAEFDRLLGEIFRVLRPGGVSSHQVDLRDHLGGALNNLRFSARFWEHPAVATAGFYTNRLRFGEIGRRAAAQGFRVSVPEIARWETLPTPRHRLAPEFRALTDDGLDVAWFCLVLQKPERGGAAMP